MQSFEERSVRSWSEESNGTKTGGRKKSCLEVAVAAPARVIVVSSSPLGRVALRDAMRALSCVPDAIAATFEDTAADLARERRGCRGIADRTYDAFSAGARRFERTNIEEPNELEEPN